MDRLPGHRERAMHRAVSRSGRHVSPAVTRNRPSVNRTARWLGHCLDQFVSRWRRVLSRAMSRVRRISSHAVSCGCLPMSLADQIRDRLPGQSAVLLDQVDVPMDQVNTLRAARLATPKVHVPIRSRPAHPMARSVARRAVIGLTCAVILGLALIGALVVIQTVLCPMTHDSPELSSGPVQPSAVAQAQRITVHPLTLEETRPVRSVSQLLGSQPGSGGLQHTLLGGAVVHWPHPAEPVGDLADPLAGRAAELVTQPTRFAGTRAASRVWAYNIPEDEGDSGQLQDPGDTDDLPAVIRNATNWLRAIAASVAVLLMTYGGLRWLMAREPGDVERAKTSFGAACAGFVLALMAPAVVSILQGILGVSGSDG